jgi:hypothetical protein
MELEDQIIQEKQNDYDNEITCMLQERDGGLYGDPTKTEKIKIHKIKHNSLRISRSSRAR